MEKNNRLERAAEGFWNGTPIFFCARFPLAVLLRRCRCRRLSPVPPAPLAPEARSSRSPTTPDLPRRPRASCSCDRSHHTQTTHGQRGCFLPCVLAPYGATVAPLRRGTERFSSSSFTVLVPCRRRPAVSPRSCGLTAPAGRRASSCAFFLTA